MSVIRAGDRVGNYLLDQLCGEGSFAQVWRARHHVLDHTVAIKIPTDPQYVRNLQREGVAIHGLRHPNIVRALDLDPYADPPYLVMEYVPGATVREVIDDHPAGLPLEVAEAVLRGVLQALRAAHDSGVFHRDLKPANILLTVGRDDLAGLTPEQVKVADFGLGRIGTLTTASILQSGSIADPHNRVSGTIAYMAPEQRDGLEVDQRCDLYAWGLLLFELLTGRRPQGSDRPSDLRSDVPQILDHIFQKCHTRLERRYESAERILGDLDAMAASRAEAKTTAGGAGATACPACHGTVLAGDQFCIHCGRQLADHILRCPRCAAVGRPDDNYCILCGVPLRGHGSPVVENPVS